MRHSTTLIQTPVLFDADRWPSEKANAWYDGVKWPVGANFVPSTAINPLEMWQADLTPKEGVYFNPKGQGILGTQVAQTILRESSRIPE